MALMFCLSGLFVAQSLKRKGAWPYARDRLIRLGLPFVFGVLVLIPIATYPAYLVTAADPSVAAYWNALLALPFWVNGPLWFLWQLLALNLVAAALYWFAPQAVTALGRWSATADVRFTRYFAALLAASAIAYVPLALAFTPWAWSEFGRSTSSFAGCCSMRFTSLPASASAQPASSAVSSASTACWRGTGRAGSRLRSSRCLFGWV